MTTPFPLLFLSAWLLLLSSEVSTRPQAANKPDAVAKSVIPDPAITRKMKEYKTEVIKSRILNEVNLPEPPVIMAPVHIPQHLLNLLIEKEVKEFTLGEGENLIAYPFNDNTSCRNETLCARYEFKLSPDSKPMSSMHVWVQKKIKSMPLEVTVCLSTSFQEAEEQDCEYQEKLFEVKTEKGWSVFELPYKFFMEPRSESLFCAVEISGSTTQINGDQKPFIVANLNPAASERKRRSTANDANKNCTCCLVDFYVSFKELDWPWVVAPLGFNANMCYGKCNYQLNSYPSHYHRMLSTILNNKTTSIENKEDLWTPCCSPTKLKPLDMIYVASNNTNTNTSSSFIYHKIPNMITESCGCW
ncbi:hypothetical protein AVEN_676-1 [Araneus ventricosus]|uniref:TGF-beta family profile domain-containing protein n=1 Tax=Araneus ventricosus TaxID=182803 RepID=A0A4Y2BVF2_ARAVE|nr:hypothetical protein AVEN_676-1 [Araneus ventricosus]